MSQQVRAEAARPFDLATGPLLRVTLFRLAAEDHYLMITMHHIVSDGWSLSLLLDEMSTAYTALAAGNSPKLPELPIQYAEFAAWQRDQVTGPQGNEALKFWEHHLRGAPALLTLPTDRQRPARQSHRGRMHAVTVPADLAQRLRELRVVPSGTMFMTLLAAFSALLSRYSGQQDVVVGTAVAGRSTVDTEALIGFFVNTIPLRTSVAGNPTFRELVGRVRNATLDGIEYADFPFERIVEALQPQRELGYAPIFQAQLTLQSTPPVRLALPGVRAAEPDLIYPEIAKYDLTVAFAERGTELCADLEYNTDLFDEPTITQLADRLLRFLSVVVADPDIRVEDVSLLTEEERVKALVDWNDTALPLPDARTALDLFAARVSARPQAIAVRDRDGELTYAELDRRANAVAHRLRAAGVGPDVAVALCVERSVAMVVALLGVWKAGGAYLPLVPSWPVKRLRHMVSDAGATVAVVDGTTAGLLGDLEHLVLVDSTERPDAPQVELSGEHLAYLIYTSGSTGTPKGVAVTHGGVTNHLVACDALFPLSDADTWAAVTTLSFDISVLELLLPLTSGAQLFVVDGTESTDPVLLRNRLESCGATVLQSTPSRWRLLLGAGDIPARVRTRLCGGEALTRELADALRADGATLWNLYGPTEATIWATAGQVSAGPIELGRPLGNQRVYVLDKAMRPAPVGVVGEIHIGGLGLARGYHGRPDLTARQFLPDPFSGPGARLYATGDLARYRSGGRLEFLGRVDHQVKVRGYRIELGEIEAALRGHPRIRDAVVAAWSVGADDTRLAAYVVPEEPAELAELWSAVRPHLAELLPDYMVPATLVLLDALPMTPASKVDRNQLTEPDWAGLRDAEAVAPATPVQLVLAGMWQELLGVQEIGIHDDFFALGGHSMLAARLLAMVRDHFQLEVPVLTLFEARTVATFAEALRELAAAQGKAELS